jgi:hypothetical protein
MPAGGGGAQLPGARAAGASFGRKSVDIAAAIRFSSRSSSSIFLSAASSLVPSLLLAAACAKPTGRQLLRVLACMCARACVRACVLLEAITRARQRQHATCNMRRATPQTEDIRYLQDNLQPRPCSSQRLAAIVAAQSALLHTVRQARPRLRGGGRVCVRVLRSSTLGAPVSSPDSMRLEQYSCYTRPC